MIRRHAALDTKCWEKNLRSSGDWVAWTLVATAGPFVYVPNFTALEYRELSSESARRSAPPTTISFLPWILSIPMRA